MARAPGGNLIQDSSGNFYGTTAGGGNGTSRQCKQENGGCGTVFKLSPDGSETVLHAFTGKDGTLPIAGLTSDGNGYFTAQRPKAE